MNKFDIFDEQTDFSFLGLAEAKTPEVSKTQAKRTPLVINGNSISVKIHVEDIGKWNIGKKHSKEHRAKLTAVRKGRKLSGEALDNVLAGIKNRERIYTPHTEATKAKIAAAHRGRPSLKAKLVMTPIGVFHTKGEAAKVYGITGWWMGWLIRTPDSIGEGFYYVDEGGKKPDARKVVKVKVVKVKGPVGQGQTKKIMTPAGEFRSRNEAARFFGFRPKQITQWTKAFPTQFYYIKD